MPRLGYLYPGICLTTEVKVRKNLSQGSRIQEHVFGGSVYTVKENVGALVVTTKEIGQEVNADKC